MKPDWLVSGLAPALATALAIGVIGLLGMATDMPWLFASLGPTLAIQTGSPGQPSARPWNVVAGQLSGMSAGFIAVYATGAVHMRAVNEVHLLSAPRVAAAALAVSLSILLQHALRARHPAAESTTLLLALGGLQATAYGALTVVIGVVLTALLGEGARRLVLKAAVDNEP